MYSFGRRVVLDGVRTQHPQWSEQQGQDEAARYAPADRTTVVKETRRPDAEKSRAIAVRINDDVRDGSVALPRRAPR